MPHSTSTAPTPMKPFSRSLQRDLDAAVDDDDGKQHFADDGDGKQNTERGLRRPSRLFSLALLFTVLWALVFYHHFSTSSQQSGKAAVAAPTVLQLKPSAFFSQSRFFRLAVHRPVVYITATLAIRNATFLSTEASPRHGNDFALPFPSHFHPTSDAQVTGWQDRMRRRDRAWLWCFAGWPRAQGIGMGPERAEIIEQCGNSSRCSMLGKLNHYVPMRLLGSAEFCMQPRGDGYTRKSTFDAILAGCHPVFFHPVSAYLQYTWHLPRDYRSYSVFIPHGEVVARNVSIEEVLRKIPSGRVAQMRERVIQLIPTVMYRHPAAKEVTFKDAFDVALERVLHRVAKRRRAVADGREYVDSVDGRDSWKYDLMLEDGQNKIGPHEFDQYVYMNATKD
uniref:Xyloglucan galactosyltransferase KATAMARI1-like protein n=1 Tax=Aegilops tauschii TaxID=37682 RepID=M8D8J2_AEGTA